MERIVISRLPDLPSGSTRDIVCHALLGLQASTSDHPTRLDIADITFGTQIALPQNSDLQSLYDGNMYSSSADLQAFAYQQRYPNSLDVAIDPLQLIPEELREMDVTMIDNAPSPHPEIDAHIARLPRLPEDPTRLWTIGKIICCVGMKR